MEHFYGEIIKFIKFIKVIKNNMAAISLFGKSLKKHFLQTAFLYNYYTYKTDSLSIIIKVLFYVLTTIIS